MKYTLRRQRLLGWTAAADCSTSLTLNPPPPPLTEILKLHGSIPRYNPRLMPLDASGPGYVRISGETGAPRSTGDTACMCM